MVPQILAFCFIFPRDKWNKACFLFRRSKNSKVRCIDTYNNIIDIYMYSSQYTKIIKNSIILFVSFFSPKRRTTEGNNTVRITTLLLINNTKHVEINCPGIMRIDFPSWRFDSNAYFSRVLLNLCHWSTVYRSVFTSTQKSHNAVDNWGI